MKYRTVIEIICDDTDADNASFTAGEYLRGNVDTGVFMSCRTTPFNLYLFKRLTLAGVMFLLIAAVVFL
jgi:hypothetical protein